MTLISECFGEPDECGYAEAAVVRTVEEGEAYWYRQSVGHPPNNLDPSHPAYKLWTYKNARSGNVLELIAEYESKI